MLLTAYAALFTVGLYLNRGDRRMLLLTLVVGASVFIAVPRHSAFIFYTFCILADLLAAILAITLRARASELVVSICVALEAVHVMGYILDGYPPLSSYRILVPILESAQLVACVCMSSALYRRLQNRST